MEYKTRIKRKLLSLYFLLCTLCFILVASCNTTEPPNNGNLTLSVEDVSSTEAWLKLKTENISLPANVTLLQNNSAVQTISLGSKDTTIYIDSLLPNKTYTFQASGIGNPVSGIQSNKVNVTTLDTTSHNFKFSTYTFGEQGAGSSYLNDVAIVNDSSIWAVGAIYLKDSTGQPDPKPYNRAIWNGSKWKLRQVPFLSNGQSFNAPIYSIFVINENDIWLGIDQLIHWDGKNFNSVKIPDNIFPSRINKIWGTSSDDLYIVGDGGNIAHYQNDSWQKLESGTELPINYIWGSKSQITNEIEIIAAASDKFLDRGKKLLAIKESKVSAINDTGLTWSLSSIWFHNKYKVYIVGDGIFVKNYPLENWQNITENITTFYTHSINGKNLNDIVVTGSGGELVHFNGSTWQRYRNNELPSFQGNYYSAAIKENIICAVGEVSNSNKAIIALGVR